MTLHQALSFAVLAGLLILFVWDRLRFDIVALLALLAAVACGIVPMDKAFGGFSNPLLPLIASALVVSNAVGKSGLIEQIVHAMRPLLQRRSLQVGVLSSAVAFLSAIVKNIGALATISKRSRSQTNRISSPARTAKESAWCRVIGATQASRCGASAAAGPARATKSPNFFAFCP